MRHLGKKLLMLAFLLLPFRAEAQSYNELQYIYARAAMGDVNALRSWAARGGNLDIKDSNGDTPYCMAVRLQNQTAVQTLAMAGADTSPWCMRRWTVVTESMIYDAADDGDTKQISLWQRHGISPDVMDEEGNTALCEAVSKHNCPAIDILLKAGANQYHPCLNRIPVEVRRTLDCKEVVRDWSKFGMTLLGGGAIAGVVIALANGGGSDSESCAEGQHWNGTECITCLQDQYWDKKTYSCVNCPANTFSRPGDLTCTSCPNQDTFFNRNTGTCDTCAEGSFSEGNVTVCDTCGTNATWDPTNRRCVCNTGLCYDQTNKKCRAPTGVKYTTNNLSTVGEYIDPTTGYCMPIAPSPNDSATYTAELAKYQPGGTYNEEYVYSQVLSGINAANAYARGYTGYVVNRGNAFGADPVVTTDQVKVGVLSSGMVVNNEGVSTPENSTKNYTRYVNTDFLDSSGSLVNVGTGYNFDSGVCKSKGQKNCYSNELYEREGYSAINLVTYTDDKNIKYAINATTFEFVPMSEITSNELAKTCLAYDNWSTEKYAYVSGYNLSGNTTDANPHYSVDAEWTTDSTPKLVSAKFSQDGSQLAALIAASRNYKGIMGVAFNAQILPVVADVLHPLSNGNATNPTNNALSTLISGGASVILQDIIRYPQKLDTTTNIASQASMGDGYLTSHYYTSAINAYTTLKGANAVLVVPTGKFTNNTSWNASTGAVSSMEISDATIDAGAPLALGISESDTSWKPSDLLGHFVSVTAVEYDSDHSVYHLMKDALPCGSTGGYCLSAPGNAIASISPETAGADQVSDINGTSAAAAVVAGSIALLKGAYPHLTTAEVVEILYRTATPLGALAGSSTGIDTVQSGKYGSYSTIYGYGLVNLEAATRPVGPLWVNNGFSTGTDGNAQYMPYINAVATTSKAVSTRLASVMPTTMTAYDSYNRPFEVSLAGAFTTQSANRYDFEDDFHAFLRGRDTTTIEPNERFSMTYAPRYSTRSSVLPNGQMEMKLNSGNLTTTLFYAEDTQTRGNYFERVLNNPLIQIQEAYGFSSAYQLNNQFQVGASYTAGKNGFYGDGDKDFEAPENKISAFSVDMAYRPIKSVAFKTSYGMMEEDESVLGMMGEGSFALKGASTAFVGAGVSLRPTDKLKLDLMYTYGWTTPKTTDGLMRISKLTSDGFALTAQYQPDENQLWGFSFSSPLKVNSGKVSVALPTGRSADSDTYYSQIYSAPLKPTARELAFALFYKDKVSDDLTIQSELGLRLNPDHQSEVKTDYRGMLGLKYRY